MELTLWADQNGIFLFYSPEKIMVIQRSTLIFWRKSTQWKQKNIFPELLDCLGSSSVREIYIQAVSGYIIKPIKTLFGWLGMGVSAWASSSSRSRSEHPGVCNA